MENYEVIKLVGEGSFARVYKAKHKYTESIVALKVIGKHGRTKEEIICLRREFEIQRRLNHRNIIRMLDSFETNIQIVAVTDYAHEALYSKLGTDGYLSEEQACRIVCDLVSALYYLHSNRVLHRDLKPQNILLEKDGTAKLCDFGFARSMTTGTHVLTSIKGTPLYMAPELIEEKPYDHNADLWSLGCIAYELLVGSPPFQTTSIVRLVRLIQNEPVRCPDFLSQNSRSFLEGLLEKNPAKRLTWPQLLYHPFVAGRVYIDPEMSSRGSMDVVAPLTYPLTVSQTFAKERQIKHLAIRSHKLFSYATRQREEYMKRISAMDAVAANGHVFRSHPDVKIHGASPTCDGLVRAASNPKETTGGISASPVCSSVSAIVGSSITSAAQHLEISPSPGFSTDASSQTDPAELASNKFEKLSVNSVPLANHSSDSRELVDAETQAKSNIKVSVVSQKNVEEAGSIDPSVSKAVSRTSQKVDKIEPIQCDEWIVFLKQTIEEVMDGQVEELMQENFVGILVAPLRNPSASSQVVDFIACLLSLPFIVKNVTEEQLAEIKEVYLEVKVVPNLVYASNLLSREKLTTDVNKSLTSDLGLQPLRPVSSFSALELQALDHIYLVLCKIMYESGEFLTQFCDATAMLNSVAVLRHFLLLGGRKVCIVTDLLAILCHVMRNLPENANLVEQIVLVPAEGDKIELIRLLNHQNPLVRSRSCLLLSLLGRFSCRALQAAWNSALKTELEKLNSDKAKSVRATSREAVRVLSALPFYNGFQNG